MQSDLTSFRQYPEKGVSGIRIQILVPHPKMHLVPTFGKPAPASFVPEGTGSTIIWQSYLSTILDSCSPPRKTQRVYFAHTPRILSCLHLATRSNERRYREKDLAMTGEKKVGTGEKRGAKKTGVVKGRHGWTIKYYKEEEAELLEVITAEGANQIIVKPHVAKSLDEEIVKMVRLLTVKVPNKSDGWEYFFSSLEKAFASEMVRRVKTEGFIMHVRRQSVKLIVNLGEEELKDYESLKQVVLKGVNPLQKYV
ncbi:hypothetical protein TNCV_1717081 [Trichonephila clavipes]|nr:hypothetical protein TNCV_1717081 [Trichonephila clavipes]